jgi:hypothetical protein
MFDDNYELLARRRVRGYCFAQAAGVKMAGRQQPTPTSPTTVTAVMDLVGH